MLRCLQSYGISDCYRLELSFWASNFSNFQLEITFRYTLETISNICPSQYCNLIFLHEIFYYWNSIINHVFNTLNQKNNVEHICMKTWFWWIDSYVLSPYHFIRKILDTQDNHLIRLIRKRFHDYKQ